MIPHEKEKNSTTVNEADLRNGIRDEYGTIYSPDGQRLLKGRNERECFVPRITVICDKAFERCYRLERINIPESIELIGDFAFYGCI